MIMLLESITSNNQHTPLTTMEISEAAIINPLFLVTCIICIPLELFDVC